MILVTGATGTTGQHVTTALLRARTPFRVLVRDTAKGKAAKAGGAEVVGGDFENRRSLAGALEGVETALLLMPPDPRQGEWQDRFVSEAKRAGTRRIVRLSALGASLTSDVPFLRWHGEGEQALERSGLAWVHVRPNLFMQNFLGQADAIRAGTLPMALGSARVSMVDVRDVAEVTARALADPSQERLAHAVTGPESLSGEEAAARLSTGLGWPVRYQDVPPDAMRAGLAKAGLPPWLVEALDRLYATFRTGAAAATTDTVARVAKTAPRTLDRFARDHAVAFRGPAV